MNDPANSHPLFTIITPSLNCRQFLPRNIASIRQQGLPAGSIEHWVIDGGSKDGTVEWLREQPDLHFVSEKDRGLSDAVNKGIQRATGTWILWLNADDELAPGALPSFLAARREFPEFRLFCGAEKIYDYEGRHEGTLPPRSYRLGELLGIRTDVNQAATFVHRDVYARVGLLDLGFRYAMDYELTVRAAREFPCKAIPAVLAHYHRRRGSIMDTGIANQHREFLRVRRQRHQSYLGAGELRIRFYLATEPLRRQPWIRRFVRTIKGMIGIRSPQPLPTT